MNLQELIFDKVAKGYKIVFEPVETPENSMAVTFIRTHPTKPWLKVGNTFKVTKEMWTLGLPQFTLNEIERSVEEKIRES